MTILYYEKDISSDFTRQMLSLKGVIIDSLSAMKTITGLANYILENYMASLLKNILTTCIIFISLPITVASAKRSFSKLNLIKNYLRNSLGQKRLSNISILNIERSI